MAKTDIRTGRPAKRRAVLDGALAVFAEHGYTLASIDSIAAAAGVSTRTIYNHFEDKAQLFTAVLEESTTGVADYQIGVIERALAEVTDVEAQLVELGLGLAAPMAGYAEHFALIRRLDADVANVPPAAVEAWQASGPRRVLAVLADRLQQLAGRGLLHIDDPQRAAVHFMVLVQGAIPYQHGLAALDDADVSDVVTAGVRAFLHGYLA